MAARALAAPVTALLLVAAAAQPAWPQVGYDARRSGGSPYAGPSTPALRWSLPAKAATPPVVGAARTVFFGALAEPTFYAVDGATGAVRWTYTNPALGGFPEAAAVTDDGSVVVGATTAAGGGGVLLALNGSTGALRWSVDTVTPLGGPVTVVGGDSLYAATAGDATRKAAVLGLDAGTGAVRWNASGTLSRIAACKPVYAAALGLVLVSEATPEGRIAAFDGATGALVRSFYANALVSDAMALGADGTTLYVPTANNALVAVTLGPSFFAYRFAVGTGGPLLSAPAVAPAGVAGGAVIFGAGDGKLRAVHPSTGAVLWERLLAGGGPSNRSSPVVGPDGLVYVGTPSGVAAVNASTGVPLWVYATPAAVRITGAVTADGTLVVAGDDGSVIGLWDRCLPTLFYPQPFTELSGAVVSATLATTGTALLLPSEGDCRQACCDAPACDGYSFAGELRALSPSGSAGCFLFVNLTQLVPSVMMASGVRKTALSAGAGGSS
jgi:outer membrane protein assembly factor BamB